MKRNLAYVLSVMLIAVASCSFTNKSFETSDKDKLLLDLITYVLEKGHYQPRDINDDFSVHIFEDFIDVVDPTKRYFISSDIKEFEKYKFQIDDQIKNTDISFFDLVYKRLMERMEDAKNISADVLSRPFDYSIVETIDTDYKSQLFLGSKKELKERWRKQLKYATLNLYDLKLHDNKDSLIVNDSIVNTKYSIAEIEKLSREYTKETLDEFFDLMDDLERKDWFVQYINTIVDKFDPHTYYFAPNEKEKFDTSMSGKFEGIGARLQKKKDHTKIVEVISGGPAWRDQRLEVGDEIIKVGQNGETPINIVGMRLNDAIKFIKGPKGTIVDLTIKKVNGTIEFVSLTRDIVELEESYVKSATVIKGTHKYGVINLPKFYVDFNDYRKRNAASDVAKEVDRLKNDNIEGLILDLRNNGGGSLKTVVEMAGLFIKDGPIVQVISAGEKKEVFDDKDKRIQWSGPLVVMVNELSASASEILAAAMQDYKRAIVIGGKQTFGKGTVQNVIPLSNIVRNNEYGDLGAIKLTMQKFYRINGGSTQLEGVKSDVVVPDKYSFIDIGERGQSNPLVWDKISPAEYELWEGYIDYEQMIANSKKRVAANPQIKLIEENARWIKEQQDEHLISLNFDVYKVEMAKDNKRIAYFKKLYEYDSNLTFESLKYEEELFAKDSTIREKRNRWHKNLAKDVYVEEAINVLKDLNSNIIKRTKLASAKG